MYGGEGDAGTGWPSTPGSGSWPYGGPPGASPLAPAGPPEAPRRRRTRGWIAVGAVVVAGAVAVGVVAGPGRSHGSGTSSPGGSASASASPSDTAEAAVEAQVAATKAARDAALPLLAARSAALSKGDLAGWLAPVDPQQPALIKAQTVLFQNLRQLPLASYDWSADPIALSEGYPIPDSVRSQIAGGSGIAGPEMLLTYQLRGFDQVPVVETYVPVVFRRDGKWYLGADLTTQASHGAGRVEPWTLGAVRVTMTPHSLVIVSAGDAGRLKALAATADASIGAVAAMWPSGWSRKAVVYATRDADVFATFLGRDRNVEDADGLTLGVGPADHRRPHDDTRVVLNTKYVPPGSKLMPALLRHEFTHVALWNGEKDGTPTWAVEGIAEYTAYRKNPTSQRVSNKIGKDAKAHRLALTLPTSSSFYGGVAQSYHYGIAWLAWEYMGETYGDAKVRAMYGRLSAISVREDSAAALAAESAAFVAVLHMPERTYVKKLDAWIAKVIRPV